MGLEVLLYMYLGVALVAWLLARLMGYPDALKYAFFTSTVVSMLTIGLLVLFSA